MSPLVVVVDDSPPDRELAIRAILKGFPEARIEAPIDESSFHGVLAGHRPDVVVTDYRIGWTDGLEVLRRVKQKDPAIPVIMFTNTGSEEVCAEGMKAGLADYIIKRRDQYPKVSHAVQSALERVRMQAELAELLQRERRASRLKDEFLATLSHELRTPLNAVLGWAHLLQMKKGDERALQQGLDVIIRNTRLQAQLVADLLDMSRIVSGQMRLDVQPMELAAPVAAAAQSVKPMADAKGVVLVMDVTADPLPVLGDPSRLEQVAWNLLTNAVKFTPAGGRVTIRVAKEDTQAVFEVTDTGQGIAAEFVPHVFEMFRQADGSRSRQHGGLGIGLSIVKQLVVMHGATVQATSEGEGRGARFTVRLPISASDGAIPRRRAGQAALAPDVLRGVVVLTVDDHADTCALISEALQAYGARVECAYSAAEGLEVFRRIRPHVLLSDIGMPGEDGYTLIGRVRKLAATEGGATPAAALSAFARSEDRQRALLAGFDGYASKPIEPVELAALVAGLAGR